jgi:hypothetical protein
MADKVFNIIIKLLKQGGADSETVKGLMDIKNAMIAGTAIIGGMTAAYYAVDKVLEATVDELVTLTGEVEKFHNQTGMSAEDSSRLVEVMKDLEISAGDVGTAFKFAEKNGFAPTLQSLKDMQAQYLTLNPGVERTQFLLKEFGKSGLNLQKFFETGDIAQRLEEVNKAMIISDDTIRQVQIYKDSLDDVKDTEEGLKLAFGKKIFPWWIEVVQGLANVANGQRDVLAGREEYDRRFGAGSSTTAAEARSLDDWATHMRDAALAAGNGAADLIDYADQLKGITSLGQDYMKTAQDMVPLNKDLAQAQLTYNRALQDSKNLGFAVGEITRAKDALALLSDGDHNTTVEQLALTDAQKKYDDALKNSVGLGYATTQLNNAKTAVENLQKAQDLQTASWMLNIMTQELSVDGLTDAEFAFLLKYQEDTGLLNRNAAARAQAAWDSVHSQLDAYAALDGATSNIYVITHLQTITDSSGVTGSGVGVTSSIIPPMPSSVGGRQPGEWSWQAGNRQWIWIVTGAGGLDFTVPPGFPNDSYPIRVQSGEHVSVTPVGGAMMYSNQQSQNVLENNISTRALEQASDRQTAMLRSMQNSLEGLPSKLAAEIQKRR